jgi:riboflavin synthase
MLGTVRDISGSKLTVEPALPISDIAIGESISVNGCCLTVTNQERTLEFDLSEETVRRTAIGDLVGGSIVNLERAMLAGGRFGGHIVQGHLDSTGRLLAIQPAESASEFVFEAPSQYAKYLIDKGSICVDGISLTVVAPRDAVFSVWVIPHTLENTNLGDRRIGDRVNLEFDVIAKYVERLTKSTADAA